MKAFVCLAAALAFSARLAAAQLAEAAVQQKVASLLAQMSQDEKIGQLIQYSQPGAETGPALRSNIGAEVRAGRCGSMLNVVGADNTRAMQELAVNNTRLHIPLLFGLDVIHGFRTIFPINLGQAASWDPAMIEQADRIAATEAAAAGIHWTFAPMVDIARDPRWGRISEGAGEDPYLGSVIARAEVRGFQGDDLSRTDTILACAKHFAGYGAAEGGRDYNTTDIPEITLRDIYLPPFHAAVEAGVGTLMAAFNDLNDVPCSANSFLLTQVLRHEWGFKGFVVSDWGSIRELIAHGIAADDAAACRLAMNAGLDMDMEGRVYGPELAKEIDRHEVSSKRLDDAVSAVLAAKVRLGLFDDPYRYCDAAREKSAMLRPESLEAARTLARESCVLLKNARSTLPLRHEAHIALIGQLASVKRDLLGSWQGRGREEDAVSIREALEAAFPDQVTYVQGAKTAGDDRSGFAAAIAAAKRSDVVVAVLGEGWYLGGEASSRTHLSIPGVQSDLLAELHQTGKPVVLVLFSSRPLTLAGDLPNADAVLLAWMPGTMGGPAIADLLSGQASPSGKLPVTFPRVLGQIPIFYNHMMTGRPADPARPNYKFMSRYVDAPNSPEFPFGYGLSYTTFSFTRPQVAPTLAGGGEEKIAVTVTNTGSHAGTEVAQLYVRDVVGSVTRPVRELKGFQRVALNPGESRQITFTLKPADLAFTHADMSFTPEPGKFEVFVGGDSDAPKVGEFELTE
ncbi:MAG TPA: glycoside hydrolase family 3 N-terminal domain-containing protein [Opitutus sp.]|nr:glycoside hydrolase family 3 N-terminal domain-containing protein [Opitutus sp.]